MASCSKTNVDVEHERSRYPVCVVCYREGKNSLSKKEVESVETLLIDRHDVNNPDFPAAICEGCHLLLNRKEKGHDIALSIIDDYNPSRSLNLRSSKGCSCKICAISRADKQDAVKLKKGGKIPSQSK